MTTDAPTGLDWTFPAMGTRWRIHHAGGVSGAAAQAVADRVAADERRWSRFIATSDVSRITRGAGTPVAVSSETIELVGAAREWHERTKGAFDPLVGSALVAWGYATSGRGTANERPAVRRTRPEGDPDLVIDPDRATVTIPRGAVLDLGGIGKSWSAVRAGRWLADEVDDERLIIDAGGDLAIARGTHTIRTAAGPVRAAEGTGVATSSTERRTWALADGSAAHHLIDPRSQQPSRRGTAVVAGVDPVAADVLASVAVIDPSLVAEREAAVALVATNGAIERNRQWADLEVGVEVLR